MKGKISLTLWIFVVFIGLIVVCDAEALPDQPTLAKIYLRNQNDVKEIVAMGFDVIEFKPGFIKVLASREQISLLERSGLKVEYLSLSEVVDESVVGKADAGLYHNYTETVDELRQIEASHGNIAKLFVIGKSIQGRDILAIKISDNPAVEEAEEPEVLYMGCHHAREWISVEIPMHLAN